MPNSQEDKYRKFILPALGILETIATKGRSPGTTALQQEGLFRQRDIDAQNAEAAALQRKLLGAREEREAKDYEEGAYVKALDRKLKERQLSESDRKISEAEGKTTAQEAKRQKLEAMDEPSRIKAIELEMALTDPKGYLEYATKRDKPPALPKPPKAVPEKLIPATESEKLSASKSAIEQLDDLGKTVTPGGPTVGRFKALNPYDTDAAAFNAKLDIATQVVAKALEGGKLSDQDIMRYRKMLPAYTDTPETFKKKLKHVRSLAVNKYNNDLKTNRKVGYSVGELEEMPNEDRPPLSDIYGYGNAPKQP